MKEHIIKKLKENPEKTLNALKMLEIDLFQKHGGLNFESLLINMDDVFFEKFPNLIFCDLKIEDVNLIQEIMLKFKYSPTYNKKNTSIISHLVKNELFKYSLLKNDELNLYNSFILENENNSNNISYVKNDLIENFILNYIISFESIIRNNELSIHDIECQINKFINNVSEKTIYFKNLSVDNIINHLYLKNKKDVLNIILKIVLKNGLVFKDLLLEKTKNKILENFFDYDYLPNSLDLLKGIESEVEISKNKLMKEKKEMFNNDVNKCENLSSLIKMEIENIDMQKMTNRNIESICSLKDNLLLINLINEKNKFNKIIQLKDEELVKKRI